MAKIKRLSDDTFTIDKVRLESNYLVLNDSENFTRAKPSIRLDFKVNAGNVEVLEELKNITNEVFNSSSATFGEGTKLQDIRTPLKESFIKSENGFIKVISIKASVIDKYPPLLIDQNRNEIKATEFHNGNICKVALTLQPYNFKDADNHLVIGIAARVRALQKLADIDEDVSTETTIGIDKILAAF